MLLSYLWFLLFGVSYAMLEQSKLEKFNRVRYLVYTKENQSNFADIRDVDFTANVTTVFIIHGFFTISLLDSHNMKDNLFKYADDVDRVILVSWLDYSTYSDSFNAPSVNYHKIAKIHAENLARDIKEKLVYIHKKGAGKIELIGHDLGAHIAGVSGRLFKLDTGSAIHKIVGLDPAGRFFNDNPERALQQSDAKNVYVFHTNTERYGYKRRIGPNDVFIEGKQPKCKSKKLQYDICSHKYAWQLYANYVKDKKVVNQKSERIHSHRYVLCLDVSRSMDENSRLIRAIGSGKNLISKMNVDSYMGIVIFSDDAEMTHDIIQIKGDTERKSLISKLPRETIGGTSIGAGLNLSMHMLRALNESDKLCSTIVLLSDGMQNTGLSPENVLPKLQEACIGVNSIALGAQASNDLEKISSQTNGQVTYAMENENSQDIADADQALFFSFENEIDADIRPIYLPSKRVTFNNDKNVVSFVIDKNIGKDTEFNLISDGIDNTDVTLTSPKGQIYSPASSEYSFDASRMQKKYKIGLAEPGEWSLHVAKSTKNRRSIRSIFDAIVTVSTYQSNDKISPIRLDATVSNRILEYPKTASQQDVERARIIVSAEVRIGRLPIIHANVFAHIKGPNQKTISFQLQDDGAFPDELSNDGVYTASILKLPKPERYSIVVTAASNGTAKLVPKEIDYIDRELIDCDRVTCETINYFEREANVGSIKLLSKDNEELIPPNQITDLHAMVQNETQKHISLEWTSPVDEVFDMKIERYDIRALLNGQEFENAFQFNETHIVKGSLDATNSTTGKIESFMLRIPNEIWKFNKKLAEHGFFLQLTFAVKTIGINNIISPRSNLALVSIKDRPVVNIFETEPRKKCKVLHKRIYPYGWISVTYC